MNILIEKINGLRELMEVKFEQSVEAHTLINEHLKKINGQVSKNTEFRIKGSVYLGGILFVGSVIVSTLIQKIF